LLPGHGVKSERLVSCLVRPLFCLDIYYCMDTSKLSYLAINGITGYRILAAPILLLLVITGNYDVFKWLLAISFLTDAIDGYLARRYHIVSIIGARLDSIGDDLTVGVAIIGMVRWHSYFFPDKSVWLVILILLFIVQMAMAFKRYGKMTAFHTFIAKTAAVTQSIFLLASFFFTPPSNILFYFTACITGAGLLEEIILIFLLRDYRADVKGLYWILRESKLQGK